MNILMATNTYLPFIGGVERSLETFTSEYRKRGHRVVIIAPEYDDAPDDEYDVIRVPSLTHFKGTEFSVQLPIPGALNALFKHFTPDIVHAHHPFMLGDTALRIAAQFSVPIVFTHHTFYEKYTHYISENSRKLKKFASALATEYANLCNCVFAPSASVARELIRRGVRTTIRILPTGIDVKAFKHGNGRLFRQHFNINRKSVVAGFVSRIAPEKNPEFLLDTIIKSMLKHEKLHFLIVGTGPSEQIMINRLKENNLLHRCTFAGLLCNSNLVDAYHAMDLFVFASQTETQGLVVTEAMAAGIPVIAVKGPGIEEIVNDYTNGRIVGLNKRLFCDAIDWFLSADSKTKRKLKKNAIETAHSFSKEWCAQIALDTYTKLLYQNSQPEALYDSFWKKAGRIVKAECDLLKIITKATSAAINREKKVY